jgi:hypothetical protein
MSGAPKRYPLPKRLDAALSEQAYANLRAMNARWGLSNNYLLTVLLENVNTVADQEDLDRAFRRFIDQHGAPDAGGE